MSRRGKRSIGGARHLGADFILGGSGHNAGIVNPPAANKHGYWTNDEQPADAKTWLETATRHEGSWWPWWTQWLDRHGGRQNASRRASPRTRSSPRPAATR